MSTVEFDRTPFMNIAAAHAFCVQQLRDLFGETEARAMARLVLEEMTHIPHAHLLQPEKELDANEQAEIVRIVEELQSGQPLPYIVGRIEFLGLDFLCDRRALIPRPETELLVELALRKLKNVATPRIADMGTGSGCIAISLAHARTDAEIFATDVSDAALELARVNARYHEVFERTSWIRGAANNWAAPLLPFAPFDALLSNPPYIASHEIETLQQSVREHEPRAALDGGADGLEPYRLIAAECGALLKPDGFLACELGATQFDRVRSIFEMHAWNVQAPIYDFAGHTRVLCAHR